MPFKYVDNDRNHDIHNNEYRIIDQESVWQAATTLPTGWGKQRDSRSP
jgi:uncharacterized protein YbdZ (MbtH family)